MRAIDVRLELVERQTRTAAEQLRAELSTGFQEAASRAVVLAEATDELLRRVEARLDDRPPTAPAADLSGVEAALAELRGKVDAIPTEGPVDLEPVQAALRTVDDRIEAAEPGWEEIRRRVADLAVAVVALQPTIDAIVGLRSNIDLVAGRLADLLGGPTLTELMDRLDEIADTRTD